MMPTYPTYQTVPPNMIYSSPCPCCGCSCMGMGHETSWIVVTTSRFDDTMSTKPSKPSKPAREPHYRKINRKPWERKR